MLHKSLCRIKLAEFQLKKGRKECERLQRINQSSGCASFIKALAATNRGGKTFNSAVSVNSDEKFSEQIRVKIFPQALNRLVYIFSCCARAAIIIFNYSERLLSHDVYYDFLVVEQN